MCKHGPGTSEASAVQSIWAAPPVTLAGPGTPSLQGPYRERPFMLTWDLGGACFRRRGLPDADKPKAVISGDFFLI